jgi:hypothetical protein
MIKPNFFIVGAPKCGTTAMNNYLQQHPDIFMAPKELHYFGADLETKVKLSEQEYLKYFENAGDKNIIGEASAWYLFSKFAAREIKMFSPDARILIMLRNPVDVIYSMHSQNLYDGNEDVNSFEQAIELDDERKKGIQLADAVDFYKMPTYKESVLFYEQVKRYLDVFEKVNVHIIIYDDFAANPAGSLKEILSFLGLGDDLSVNYKIINPNKQLKSLRLHRIIKKPPKRLKGMIRIVLPVKRFRHQIMKTFTRWNVNTKKRSEMNHHLRKKLQAELKDDIFLLSQLINKDLTGWLR